MIRGPPSPPDWLPSHTNEPLLADHTDLPIVPSGDPQPFSPADQLAVKRTVPEEEVEVGLDVGIEVEIGLDIEEGVGLQQTVIVWRGEVGVTVVDEAEGFPFIGGGANAHPAMSTMSILL